MCFATKRGHRFTIGGKFLFYSTAIHSNLIIFIARVCVFFEDKVSNHERLIYVKNTKRINVFTYFYFKKALFTLCIKSFVGESFKQNYVSTKVKNILYILYSLDMNSYVQQRSFCNFNINVVIIRYASTKVKNTFYYNKLLILDMNSYV